LLVRLTVRIAVFLAGATLMALEVAAFRIVGRTFGTALRETTTVIAVFMAAMSIGYWAGGRVGDRWPSRRTLAAILLLAAAAMVIVPALDRVVSPRIADSGAALGLHAFLATAALFFIPTLFLSAVSPVAVRLCAAETSHSGSTAGSIAALSTIGSIAGTILSAFVLLDWLKSIDRTVIVLAATTLVATLLVLAGEIRGRLAAIAGVAVAGLIVVVALGSRSAGAARKDPGLLFLQDSPYHHVMVRRHSNFRILKFDWRTTQTSMRVDDPSGPGLEYADYMHIAKLINPGARRVLLMGLGGGTVVKQFVRLYPDVEIDAVEIDPVVIDVAQRFFHVKPSPRVRLHAMDGRVFLRTSGAQQWDIILIDTYTTNRYGSTIPTHMVTREFFAEAARHLTPRGVLVFHCYTQSNAPMSRALHRTMANEFPTVLAFPGGQFTELFATAATDIPTRDELLARAEPLPWAPLRPRVATMIETPLSTDADPVLTDDYAPVDTLLRRKRGR
jgi:spermidine synthase